MSDFDVENKARWKAAIAACFPGTVPDSASWTGVTAIAAALRPFCGKDLNHAMFPDGGGMDIHSVGQSWEDGCIELRIEPDTVYVCRPERLNFENFPEFPAESFLLLEASTLARSGIYETPSDSSRPWEELLELPGHEYVDRDHLEAGFYGHNDDGDEQPIPEPHRIVVRFFSGKFLFVAKRSMWNRTSSTYDGRHDKLTAAEIRLTIEDALQRG